MKRNSQIGLTSVCKTKLFLFSDFLCELRFLAILYVTFATTISLWFREFRSLRSATMGLLAPLTPRKPLNKAKFLQN